MILKSDAPALLLFKALTAVSVPYSVYRRHPLYLPCAAPGKEACQRCHNNKSDDMEHDVIVIAEHHGVAYRSDKKLTEGEA